MALPADLDAKLKACAKAQAATVTAQAVFDAAKADLEAKKLAQAQAECDLANCMDATVASFLPKPKAA